MLIPPKALSQTVLPYGEMRADYKAGHSFSQGSLGKKALYIRGVNQFIYSYVPLNRVQRVYKRLAVSKGFYNGGIFGTLAYLVVRYDGGREKAFRFKLEDDVNLLLSDFRKYTKIPVGKE